MCGRLRRDHDEYEVAKAFFDGQDIYENLALFDSADLSIADAFRPRYNIAPSNVVPVIVMTKDGERQIRTMRWGLRRPPGVKMLHKTPPTNARAESILTVPDYRDSRNPERCIIETRRCIMPGNGYYEWRVYPDRTKIPYAIKLTDRELFGFAAIYDAWVDDNGKLIETCSMITTTPAPEIAHIHNRMPVILRDEHEEALWLDRSVTDLRRIMPLLRAYPGQLLDSWEINDTVNNWRNDGPELLQPRSMPITLPVARTEPAQLALVS